MIFASEFSIYFIIHFQNNKRCRLASCYLTCIRNSYNNKCGDNAGTLLSVNFTILIYILKHSNFKGSNCPSCSRNSGWSILQVNVYIYVRFRPTTMFVFCQRRRVSYSPDRPTNWHGVEKTCRRRKNECDGNYKRVS